VAIRAIFAGRAANWREVGGPDLPIRPFVVGPDSATRAVFRETVLGKDDYAGCEDVRPDAAIVERVAREPGGVGQISFAFLEGAAGVRVVSVGGEEPTVTNFSDPIARPLYLPWRGVNPAVEAFVEWTLGEEGQLVVMRRFVGAGVVASLRPPPKSEERGILVVRTDTFVHREGDTLYYPHLPYEIRRRDGTLVRRVRNRIGEADERPTPVELAPGTYLVRAESEEGGPVDFLVKIEPGGTLEARVEDLKK
jgi:hypothetical protein